MYSTVKRVLAVATGAALLLGATQASAEPKERTYPSNTCEPSSSNQYGVIWQSNPEGFAFGLDDGVRTANFASLVIECPIVKENVGEALTRAFAWVETSNTRKSTLCSLKGRRITSEGLAGTFFSNASSGLAPDLADEDLLVRSRKRLDFTAAAVPDLSLPAEGPVEEPTIYSLQCQLSAGSKLMGYHVEVDG